MVNGCYPVKVGSLSPSPNRVACCRKSA